MRMSENACSYISRCRDVLLSIEVELEVYYVQVYLPSLCLSFSPSFLLFCEKGVKMNECLCTFPSLLVYVNIYVYVCVSVFVCMRVYVGMCVCRYVYACACNVYVCVCLPVPYCLQCSVLETCL